MNNATIAKRFEAFLRKRSLRFTPQRRRIFQRAFETHEHFSAERLFEWLAAEDEPRVSRATVYRTLSLLVEGGFLDSFQAGGNEQVYEHVLGHRHHDHMVCQSCGKIEEFSDRRIERLQEESARKKGFVMTEHDLRLFGYCRNCVEKGLCPLLPEGERELPEPKEAELGKPKR